MEVDRDLVAYLTGKGSRHIEEAVEGTGVLPRTVIGIGTYLLDIEGEIDLLTSKQKTLFDRFLKPLMVDVPCQGVAGPDTCRGSGLIEPDLLLKSYRDDEYRCQACRQAKAEAEAIG